MALKRISITLPKDVLEAADQRARALDRSRSWLIVEAIRAYLGALAAARVRGTEAPAYAVEEVADARRRHLLTDLKRSPAERLRRAEDLARLARQARSRRGRGRRNQVIGFDSYEDFYEWKSAFLAGG
jgi:ribbon-helix-helix CopG family protein